MHFGHTEKLEEPQVQVNPVTSSQIDSDIQRLFKENISLEIKMKDLMLNQKSFEGNDEKVKYLQVYQTI